MTEELLQDLARLHTTPWLENYKEPVLMPGFLSPPYWSPIVSP